MTENAAVTESEIQVDRSEDAAGAVVVGIDGSEGSRVALDYALEEADREERPVVPVIAFEPSDLWIVDPVHVPSARELYAAARDEATTVVSAAVEARRAAGLGVPPIRLQVHSGPAAVVLENLSRHAALLVVGHRGRGAVTSRVMGSVGLNCVVHSRCTVVVVHG